MNITDMIMVIEVCNGQEYNYVLTIRGLIETINETEKNLTVELGNFYADLGKTSFDGNWAEWHINAGKSILASYCKDAEQMKYFVQGSLNETPDYEFRGERCSAECREELLKMDVPNIKNLLNSNLPEFHVKVSAEVSRVISVRAQDISGAIDEIMEQYKKGEIVLDVYDDISDATFKEVKENR